MRGTPENHGGTPAGVDPRWTVATWFDRGQERARRPWLGVSGRPCVDPDGLSVRFSLAVRDGIIADARFEATTCVTLIAYCEALSQRITGMPLTDAIRLSPTDLIPLLPGVPSRRQDRAVLPVRALRSAIGAIALDEH